MKNYLILLVFSKFFLSCYFYITTDTTQSDEIQTRIFGGENSSARPFYVKILLHKDGVIKDRYCGGTIIDTRYVLTSAHCIANG